MEDKRTPVIAGLGGAALIAAVLSAGGPSTAPEAGSKVGKATVAATTETRSEMTSNQDGPWYAFCQEYATDEFDHGIDPSLEKGIKGHRVPEEADEGTVEISRPTKDKEGHPETEKFNVRKHMVGDLASCVSYGAKLRLAIAFVPDPDETEMRLDFDRDIEALQSAAAAEHYNYTRFWFPWRSTNWVPDKAADPEPEMRRREEPGILCFRKSADAEDSDTKDNERLFVLLVGETPTSGVNRIQFAHALYYHQQLRGNHENPLSDPEYPNALFSRNRIVESDADRISIVGPHFSSSFTGIQDVLNRTAGTPKENPKSVVPLPFASFISPDASGQMYLDSFRAYCSDWKSNCGLRTLSLSSTQAESAAACYLEDLGYPGERIAALTEDESAFGASTFNAPTAEPNRKDPDQLCRDHQAAIELRLHFPRDLSSVRSLSDQASAKLAESGSKYFSLPGGSMPIQLTAREPVDRDSPPAFGAEQVAAQVARSLADAVEQMRARRIRAVVVGASNPLDRIYLLEYLHNALPDVRAVTFDADELELDKPHFTDLTGTIAITDLPTLPGMVNVIGHKTSPPMSFKSSRQLGEFLALEMALEPDFQPGLLADAGRCCLVSVVGSTGFRLMPYPAVGTSNPIFPRLPSGDKSSSASPHMEVPEHTKAPASLLSMLVMLITFNLVHFWCVCASLLQKGGLLSYPCKLQPSREADRAYLLFAINNQVFLLNLLASALSLATLHAIHQIPSPTYDPWLMRLAICTSVFTIAALVLCVRFFGLFITSVQQLSDKSSKQMSWVLMSFALIYFVHSILMIFLLPAFHASGSIFLERTTRIGEWLSPVFPIASIMLGYFLWGWVQLKRLGWAASRETNLYLPAGIDDSFRDRVKNLQASVSVMMPKSWIATFVSIALAFAVGCRLYNSLSGFDGGVFHLWFLIWGVGMLLLTVIITCFHAWSIWDHLKGLLDGLETTPMRDAFDKLGKNDLLHIKVWDLAKPQRSFILWKLTVESLERLYGRNSKIASFAGIRLDRFVAADEKTRQLQSSEIDKLNRRLNAAVTSGFQSMASKSPLTVPSELQIYFALRLIALIRYALLQIVTLIRFVAYGYILAIGSIVFYPFEGRKLIGDLLTITFIGLLVWIAMMMAQFQQNGMLSRLEDTTPGKVSYGEVALHLVTVAGVPLLAIITSQFPSVANFVFSLFRPVVGAIH